MKNREHLNKLIAKALEKAAAADDPGTGSKEAWNRDIKDFQAAMDKLNAFLDTLNLDPKPARSPMKYLMYEMKGSMLPVIFAPMLVHKDVAEFMSHYLRRKYMLESTLVSAGFYNLNSGKTYGESESLDLQSRPEDADILLDQLAFIPELDQNYRWRN